MTNNTRSIRSWWWGRTLPKEYFESPDLSNLTRKDIDKLRDLKQIVELAEEKGIKLPFGRYVKRNELYSLWDNNPVDQKCSAR